MEVERVEDARLEAAAALWEADNLMDEDNNHDGDGESPRTLAHQVLARVKASEESQSMEVYVTKEPYQPFKPSSLQLSLLGGRQ